MLRRWVVGCPFHWPERSLTGDTAPELLLHFLSAALFERVRAAAQRQTMRLRAESKGASSTHFMKRRFHCKKVEQVKCRVIVILSQAKNL